MLLKNLINLLQCYSHFIFYESISMQFNFNSSNYITCSICTEPASRKEGISFDHSGRAIHRSCVEKMGQVINSLSSICTYCNKSAPIDKMISLQPCQHNIEQDCLMQMIFNDTLKGDKKHICPNSSCHSVIMDIVDVASNEKNSVPFGPGAEKRLQDTTENHNTSNKKVRQRE